MDRYQLKQSIRKTIYVGAALAARGMAVAAWHRFCGQRRGLIVLMYHKVNDQSNNPVSVSTHAFKQQIRYLVEQRAVVSLGQVIDAAAGRASLPDGAVLITFDDGYLDTLTQAYPVLRDHNCPATLFVPVDFLGGGTLQHDRDLAASNPTMTWEQLAQITDVFEIGAHGCSHRVLTRLPRHEAIDEIQRSKAVIAGRLERPVRAFSYPRGSVLDFDDDLEAAVRDAGYDLCFTTIPGANPKPGDRKFNPLRLRRYNAEDFGLWYFKCLLDGSADVVGIKDSTAGYHLKNTVNRWLGIADRWAERPESSCQSTQITRPSSAPQP